VGLVTTTKRDLQALHYLAQRLRADTHGAGPWHDNGLAAVLAKLEGHNLAITVERVTRHAADPEARTPAAIERPFVPDVQKPPTPRPPKPAECCQLCGRGMHGPDVVCDRPTQRPPAKTADTHAEVDRLRALLTAPADHDGAHNDQPKEGDPDA
jgi:hypothetical protein